MTIRSRGYWILDSIRGGAVSAEIEEVRRGLQSRPETYAAGRLREQLEAAARTVPLYKKFQGATDLAEFPVMNKGEVSGSYDLTIADGVDRTSVHIASTSGSTGTPFKVLHDGAKRRRAQADAIYWGQVAGYELGEPLAYIKVWSGHNRVGPVTRIMRNVFPIDATSLEGGELLRQIERAGRRGPLSIVAYASSLEALAKTLDGRAARGFSAEELPRVTSIISQSESLEIEVRESLATHFGIVPVSRYGLEELGIVAQQQIGGGEEYRINSASHFVEVLKLDEDKPAVPGELGRIVVTDLVNRAQPLIRYDTGDLGVAKLDREGRVDPRYLARIQGRRQDRIFDTADRPLAPQVMAGIWWRYPEIRQYQLVQQGKGDYLIRLNIGTRSMETGSIVADFKKVVGRGASVKVEVTDEELVFSSGKRKRVVNLYTPPTPYETGA
ncbi:hypothetical protein OVA21_12340 [Dietzia sp. SL131]|uniref:hypothetical protein n=1 Tax=Dietzia sp. SL131 TaxID=2995149 RepID=UPI00227A39B8|nr:hypothetical protein [Dietzia sp. SL131]MCY1657972.1 hypothetical protein [Dietzia sp. SL131]